MCAFAPQSPGSQQPVNRSSCIAHLSIPVISLTVTFERTYDLLLLCLSVPVTSYCYRKTKNNSPKQSPRNNIYNIWGRFSVLFDTNKK